MLPKDIVTESILYWEPRRILYNVILVAATITTAVYPNLLAPYIEVDPDHFSLGNAFVILPILAVVANLLYCTAYIPDVFIQQSDFQEMWKSKFRPWLFWAGTALAVLFALMTTPFILHPDSLFQIAPPLRPGF